MVNSIVNAFKSAGFHIVTCGEGPTSWNCLWTGLVPASKFNQMNKYQKINHFVGSYALGNKANLWRNCELQRQRLGQDFEILPKSYIFPEDYFKWQIDRKKCNYSKLYILKPAASSNGLGIRVVGHKDQVANEEGHLVQ